MIRYLSVCSGIEAATVAWHPLGWKPVAFSEIEKFPSAVLSHHYPDVPNLGDLTKFKDWKHEPIDLLVGGTPCQAFSIAGLRKGLDDPRGNLTLTFLALARRALPDNSVDFSVFSPPFADLFTYSSDVQDMGNCADVTEFTKHFEILIAELARVIVPGREVAVHCVDLLSTKWKHGKIEFQDFSGEIIRAFWRHGFLFHSRICIWKSPVTEMQRTKAHGLLYKTLKADSCDSRVGCADYLLVFRKPGENPKPVTKDPASFPVSLWQEYASPVWMTVDQGNVLNRDGARDSADERHICPLQLDVIERAVVLWSNPGDLVFSPFAGIGSEGYKALQLGRKFVGAELKESYFKQACANLVNAGSQLDLFKDAA